MEFPARRERNRLYQGHRNDKHENVTHEREARIDSVYQAPGQADVIHGAHLPRVGPQAGDWRTVENYEAHLGDVGRNKEAQGALDSKREAVMELAQAAVEGQARDAAEEQRGGVNEVGCEVQDLALDGLRGAHHILYIL